MTENNINAPTTPGITRQDVLMSLNAYSEMLKASGKYYRKILEASQAAAEFANMLETLGKCKGAEQSGNGLKAAAELHRTISKNQEQLAEAIHKDFELPLQRNLMAHQKRVDDNEKAYEKNVRKIQEEISKTESKMLKGRKKDMFAFQQSLQDMQKLAQDLEKQRLENVDQVLGDEQKNFMFLVQKAAGVVKSQYEHFSNMSGLSRDVTEEIISIAFAPPGKTLDAAEKKRVVDKFLGATSTLPTELLSSHPRASISSISTDVSSKSGNANAPLQRPPMPPSTGGQSSSVSSNIRPVTPPVSPHPAIATSSGVASLASSAINSRKSSSAAIQESLMRLNIAANNVSNSDPTQTSSVKVDSELDLVVAIHDFSARTERELSFGKNDILLVKQRQENWLYATHYVTSNTTDAGKSGWIPVSYTTTFKQ